MKAFDAASGPVACVIVKHANPCGVALGANALEAYRKAFSTDPTSAFGGIIAFNGPVDKATAEAVSQQFMEVLIAPEFTAEAKEVLAAKQNVRVLQVPLGDASRGFDLKRVAGGLLVQSFDAAKIGAADLKVVTRRAPARRKSPICFSPGEWPSTSNPTPSSIAATARPWASAPGR